MDEEDPLDKFILDSNADETVGQINHFTDDDDILEDFAERQGLAAGGRQKLEEKLNEHNGMDPTLSGGDVDADWARSIQVGEESVGGSVSTPDQDIVDDIGEAAGLTYDDFEKLDSDKKVLERDRSRWELDPASAEDNEEEDEDDDPDVE